MVLVGRCLMGLAFLSSLLLMWPLVFAGPLVLDEHGSYWIVDSDLPGSSWTRSLDYAAIPPLSGWLQSLCLSVFGKSEFIFRLPSALCYLAAVVAIYRLGTDLHDRILGGLAALVLAWHPEAMDEVRIARCYGLVLLLSSLVLWTTWHWLTFAGSQKWSLLWTLSGAGLLWTHYTSALLVVITAAWIGIGCLRSDNISRNLKVWLMNMVGLFVLCLPLIRPVLRLQKWGPALNYMSGDQSIWSFIGPFWWLGIPTGWLLCLICRSAGRTARGKSPSMWRYAPILIAGSLLPMLILAALATGDLTSLANPRYRVAYAPASACLMAGIFRFRSHWAVAFAGTVVALAAAWTISPLTPWQLGRLGSATDTEWRDVGLHLSEHSKPGEPVFVQSGLVESNLVPLYAKDAMFMEYVACRVSRFYLESPHRRYGLPFVWDNQTGVQEIFREVLLRRNSPDAVDDATASFWIAAATDTDLNRNSLNGMQQLAHSIGYVLTEYRSWPNVRLEHYTMGRDQ